MVHKKSKTKYYAVKFDKFKGNKKKTWKIINEIRGKGKQDIKESFIIDNEHIVCRRAIADKFNKYFASIASKLNIDAYSEVPITSFPSFESYMSRSSESSIFLEDCDEAEVSNTSEYLASLGPLESLESRGRRVNSGECDHRSNAFRIKKLNLVCAMVNFTFICRTRNMRSWSPIINSY